jgi:phage terminase large subunit-like protein
MINRSERYIKNILSGKVYHGQYVLKAVQNLEKDRVNSERWEYDEALANKYIRFIEKLVFTEGSKQGQDIILEDWQTFYISQIFGWVSKVNKKKRRFIETTLCVPRKNGKSTLIGIISLACAYLDDEARGQVYMAATSQKQARYCFDSAWYAVQQTKGLSSRIKVSAHNLLVKKNQTYIRYISSEAGGIEGANPSVAILDEEHLATDNELRDALRLGMGTRTNPLFISISTAGTDKTAPYYKHIQNCKSFIDGFAENERHFALIYEPDLTDPEAWRDERTWETSNPNWGVSIDEDLFRQDFLEACNEPSKQPMFMTKRLNIWADSASTWIDSKTWQALDHKLKLSDFEGEDCYLGLDLGTTGDFSALAILFEKDGKYYTFYKFWIPEQMAGKRTKADGLKFKDWARSGFIKLTEGNSTDFTEIEEDIARLSSRFNIISLSYDSAFASMLITRLINEWGINCRPFKQAITSTAAPTKQLNEWILKGELLHENNPVMNWMLGNVQIWTDDANGNYKVHKGKSRNKVDGVTALVNAIGDYLIDYSNNYGNGDAIWV